MPSDYKFRRLRLSRRKALQPLIYVSTLLYRGTKQISNTLLTDHQRAQLEITLIKEVLSQLPYRVLYKPYPAFRYADDDPVLAVASESANIDVMTSEVDLRYMVDRHRIVMTTGATSTVGWCALSGLPLVFIDDAQLLPLSPNANSAFEKAFFLFNGSSSTLHASLRNFLSRPIPEIEAEARLREAARAAVVENLFGLGHCSSAGIALKQIHRILARSQSSGLGITHGSKAP